MESIKDELNRSFKTLRVSLINTCNLACTYCSCSQDNEKGEQPILNKQNTLSAKHLMEIIEKLHKRLGLQSIRFTGGEPLLYKDLTYLISETKKLGISNINLTTNGLLLEKKAESLRKAGLKSINISLDATDPETFFKLSRRHGLKKTFKGIDSALQAGLAVKINSVIIKGQNDNQVLPLLKYAEEKQIIIRFLEIMAMGHLHQSIEDSFFSQSEILSLIRSEHQFSPLIRKKGATANYWQTTKGNIFGIIANESQPFCGDCNRLRLDSYGNIYGCLSSNHPVSIKEPLEKSELELRIKEALAQKQDLKFTGSSLSMLHIGG